MDLGLKYVATYVAHHNLFVFQSFHFCLYLFVVQFLLCSHEDIQFRSQRIFAAPNRLGY